MALPSPHALTGKLSIISEFLLTACYIDVDWVTSLNIPCKEWQRFSLFSLEHPFLPSDWSKNIIIGSRGKVIIIKVTQCFPLRIYSQLLVHFEWENSNLQCHLEKKHIQLFFPPIFLRELLVPPCWRTGFDTLHQDNKDVRDATIKRACSCKTLKSLPNKALLKFSRYILWGFNICQARAWARLFLAVFSPGRGWPL